MKKCLALIVGILFLLTFFTFISRSNATDSASVTITVTILSSVSISINQSTLDLGPVGVNTTTVSTSGIVVTNDGSGINETYSLNLTNPSGWAASQTAPGSETYVLNAAFASASSAISWSEANHALSTTAAICTDVKFAGDQTGISVPYNATRPLWFQFKSPTSTAVTSAQSITVTITAQVS